MSNLTLQLDIQHRAGNIYIIHIDDNQAADFCIGLMMLQYEEIDTLQLSQASDLRFLKLSPKLRKKWQCELAHERKCSRYTDRQHQ